MKRTALITILLITMFTTHAHAGILDNQRIRQANAYLLKGNIDKADESYQKIHSKKPFIVYNQGLLEYAKGNTDNAREKFNMHKRYAETAHDKKTMSRNDYNIGTMYLEQGDIQNAIDYYIKALKNDPQNRDAKYNLELARILEKMRPAARKQSQGQSNDKKKDQKDKKDKQKDQKKKQAEQVLNSFKQKEQQDMRRQSQGSGKKNVEKDW